MEYKTLQFVLENELAAITLNRPEKRNAISPEMISDLMNALDQVERSSARVVILTGAGRAFCAGMDLEALRNLASQTPEQHAADAERMPNVLPPLHLSQAAHRCGERPGHRR